MNMCVPTEEGQVTAVKGNMNELILLPVKKGTTRQAEIKSNLTKDFLIF